MPFPHGWQPSRCPTRAVLVPAADPGLRLLADEPLAPALQLMHVNPGELVEPVRAARVSRTSFAERFRTVAGTPPPAYLSRWPMVLAQDALRNPDISVGALAARLGHGSGSAFSIASKRSPAGYRSRRSSGALVDINKSTYLRQDSNVLHVDGEADIESWHEALHNRRPSRAAEIIKFSELASNGSETTKDVLDCFINTICGLATLPARLPCRYTGSCAFPDRTLG